MDFIAGAGRINIDLLYQNLKGLPKAGEEIYTTSLTTALGGGVPASMAWLSRLGINTKLITQLGSDMFSCFAKSQLQKYGTEILSIKCENNPVNITSVLVLKDDRSFITYGGNEIMADDEKKEMMYNAFQGAKICIMSPGGFCDVYERLKSEGTLMLLDFGWDSEMSFTKYEKILSLADYYLPNRKEAMKLTGAPTPREAAQQLAKRVKAGVVKCDKDGAIGFKDGKLIKIDALPDINCVDATGAGDAFLAGFTYGLFYDFSFKSCISFGNITGASAVKHIGALQGSITENELIELKSKYF
ncbi:MAG: carbohydrate kinase family protein [Clostridiales bacterium]|nr:carbohydrate kinase family protein [Clostridiales bacterium]